MAKGGCFHTNDLLHLARLSKWPLQLLHQCVSIVLHRSSVWTLTGILFWRRTDDRGGMRLCEDPEVVVMGNDGRWHRVEECDDGNMVSGDGCSNRCTIEAGYSFDGVPLAGGSSVPFLHDLMISPIREGFVRLVSLGGTACRFGWVDFYLHAVVPESTSVHLEGQTHLDTLQRLLPIIPQVVVLRGIYKSGTAVPNDVRELDSVAAMGDAFVCPCAAAANTVTGIGTTMIDTDGGGSGIGVTSSFSGASVLVNVASGRLSEPEGAYVYDGVRCTWIFLDRRFAAVRLTLAGASAQAADLELLSVAALEGQYQDLGDCGHASRCEARLPATSDSISLPGGGGDQSLSAFTNGLTVGVPLRLTFMANSTRFLSPKRLTGAGGRFVLNFQQGPASMLVAAAAAAAARNAGRPAMGKNTSLLSNSLFSGPRKNAVEQKQSLRSDTKQNHLGSKVEHPAGSWSGRGGLRREFEEDKEANKAGAGRQQLMIALAGAPGQIAPCRFSPGAGEALLQLSPIKGDEPKIIQGMWSGTTIAQVAPGGSELFAFYSTGRCRLHDAIARFNVSNSEARGGVGGETCATHCVSTANCVFYSYGEPGADCLLFAFCQVEEEVDLSSGRKRMYTTLRARSDLEDTQCGSELYVRGRVVRIFIHSCSDDVSMVGGGRFNHTVRRRRRSPQTGMLVGLLLPSGPPCDALDSLDHQCTTTLFATTGFDRSIGYWTARIRWTASSRDRVIGDEDLVLLAQNQSDSTGKIWPLTLHFTALKNGPPAPANIALDPGIRPPFSKAQVIRFRHANTGLSLQALRDPFQITRLSAAETCKKALAEATALTINNPECALLVSAVLSPQSAGVNRDSVSARCNTSCRPALLAKISNAAQVCTAAWRRASIASMEIVAAGDGVPRLQLETVEGGAALTWLLQNLLQV